MRSLSGGRAGAGTSYYITTVTSLNLNNISPLQCVVQILSLGWKKKITHGNRNVHFTEPRGQLRNYWNVESFSCSCLMCLIILEIRAQWYCHINYERRQWRCCNPTLLAIGQLKGSYKRILPFPGDIDYGNCNNNTIMLISLSGQLVPLESLTSHRQENFLVDFESFQLVY